MLPLSHQSCNHSTSRYTGQEPGGMAAGRRLISIDGEGSHPQILTTQGEAGGEQ